VCVDHLHGAPNVKLIQAFAAPTLAFALAAVAAPSQATTVIFAGFDTGNSNAPNLRFVNKGASDPDSARIFTTSTPNGTTAGGANVRFSFFDDPALADFFDLNAKFTLNGSVTDTPAGFDGATYTQTGVNGSFQFVYSGPTQVLDGVSLVQNSTVLFGGNFTNAWFQGFGGVGGLALTHSNGGTANFFSDIYPVSQFAANTDEFTFHLGIVNPVFSRANPGSALRSFRAHMAGEFQADIVPEPAAWGLMILGFGCAGTILRTRRRAFATAI
jgi:hypothetical protein